MNQITFSYTTSSCSSNDLPKTMKSSRTSYLDSLHSVRKTIQKPLTKQYIAPLPPAPAKVYKIEPSKFKEAVRMLTSTPEFQSQSIRRLKDIAPPPLVLSTILKPSLFPKPSPPQPPPPSSSEEGGGKLSPLSGFTLSPDFCKFLNETLETNRFISKSSSSPVVDFFGGLSPLRSSPAAPRAYNQLGTTALLSPVGFGLSPSSLSWCSTLLLSSPNTLSGFNQSPVL